MTLKARVVNTEASAVKAIAGTIAKAVCVASFAETGLATVVRAAILVATVVRALVALDAKAENAATFAPKVVKIARAAILAGNAVKALAAQEAAVISAADQVGVVAFKVDAHPVKVDLALDREMDLVLPATGTGNPVRLTIKKTTSFTGSTR
jgi:flagellar biosynthesis protein FliQ